MNKNMGERRHALVIQHTSSENLGAIEDALEAAGVAFDYVRTFQGQPIPADVGEASALIVMGGPMGVYETDRFPFLVREMKLVEAFLKTQKPILGFCLGSQLLAAVLGSPSKKGPKKEIGWLPVQLSPACAQDLLWNGQPSRFAGFHWHMDVFDLPKDSVALASSDITPVQSFRFGDRAYGILFHMEVVESTIRNMLNEFAAERKPSRFCHPCSKSEDLSFAVGSNLSNLYLAPFYSNPPLRITAARSSTHNSTKESRRLFAGGAKYYLVIIMYLPLPLRYHDLCLAFSSFLALAGPPPKRDRVTS